MVIDLQKYKLLQELLEILRETSISPLQTTVLLEALLEGETLASALRTVGIRSPYEIPERVWVRLRPWRNKHFPLVAIEIPTNMHPK